jgi:hypothetical protein
MTRPSGRSRSGRSRRSGEREGGRSQDDWRQRHRDWTGSANELVTLIRKLIRERAIPATGSKPNVRLLRHYVSVGAVSRPERVGREAHFGFRQLVEYVVVRVLLADGWPLAKIAELVERASLEALLDYFAEHPPEPETEPDAIALASASVPGRLRQRLQGRPDIRPLGGAPAALVADSRSEALYTTSLQGVRASVSGAQRSGRREVVRVELEPGFVLEFDPERLAARSPRELEELAEHLRRALEAERRRRGGRE